MLDNGTLIGSCFPRSSTLKHRCLSVRCMVPWNAICKTGVNVLWRHPYVCSILHGNCSTTCSSSFSPNSCSSALSLFNDCGGLEVNDCNLFRLADWLSMLFHQPRPLLKPLVMPSASLDRLDPAAGGCCVSCPSDFMPAPTTELSLPNISFDAASKSNSALSMAARSSPCCASAVVPSSSCWLAGAGVACSAGSCCCPWGWCCSCCCCLLLECWCSSLGVAARLLAESP
mmetsp:Transcript_4654/g.12725  ORF Transcript_4654/g.12725 Transcript_4654/m.12725 type:complete len:229 (-) Transcript_4654:714-1400(-)